MMRILPYLLRKGCDQVGIKEEVLILNEDGAYLYAGPSKVYKKVSEKIIHN